MCSLCIFTTLTNRGYKFCRHRDVRSDRCSFRSVRGIDLHVCKDWNHTCWHLFIRWKYVVQIYITFLYLYLWKYANLNVFALWLSVMQWQHLFGSRNYKLYARVKSYKIHKTIQKLSYRESTFWTHCLLAFHVHQWPVWWRWRGPRCLGQDPLEYRWLGPVWSPGVVLHQSGYKLFWCPLGPTYDLETFLLSTAFWFVYNL